VVKPDRRKLVAEKQNMIELQNHLTLQTTLQGHNGATKKKKVGFNRYPINIDNRLAKQVA